MKKGTRLMLVCPLPRMVNPALLSSSCASVECCLHDWPGMCAWHLNKHHQHLPSASTSSSVGFILVWFMLALSAYLNSLYWPPWERAHTAAWMQKTCLNTGQLVDAHAKQRSPASRRRDWMPVVPQPHRRWRNALYYVVTGKTEYKV